MAGFGRMRGPGGARLLALCAVLFGLFLMHGSPATVAGGCHGEVGSTPVVRHTEHGSPMTATVEVTQVRTDTVAIQSMDGMAGHGNLCLATPAQNKIPLPAAPLAALFVFAALAAWALRRAWNPGGTGRRGPPGGRGLLLQVCVART
ncbi:MULTISPECIES: hypothetical protein [unclassified Streptomyces]|uniref:hypothetical protein n=1 Tax=unclassified Streptomyces TaxID=2593676 RepID=UPI00341F48F1